MRGGEWMGMGDASLPVTQRRRVLCKTRPTCLCCVFALFHAVRPPFASRIALARETPAACNSAHARVRASHSSMQPETAITAARRVRET